MNIIVHTNSILFNVLVDLIPRIIDNDVTTFKHAIFVCKSWYEKLFPYLDAAKAYKENKKIPIPIWDVSVQRVYKGVNFIRGRSIVNKISVNGIPDLTFEIVRPRYNKCHLSTRLVHYSDDTYILLVRECEFENFLLNNEYFGWIIDCNMLNTDSKRRAVFLEYAQLWWYGELVCGGVPPSISIYHWQQCGNGADKYLTFQECNE